MANIYTVTCTHAATGEGHTAMILITRAYGPEDGPTNALDRFREIFGEHFARGAQVTEGLALDSSVVGALISDATRRNLMDWQDGDGSPFGLEYFSNLHVNFS